MNDLERSAMEQALEALEAYATHQRLPGPCPVRDAEYALRAALAEPVQEPVALETVYETIIHWDEGGGKRSRRELARRIVDLYTASTQRLTASATYSDVVSNGGMDPR